MRRRKDERMVNEIRKKEGVYESGWGREEKGIEETDTWESQREYVQWKYQITFK